ncbi:acetyltransferase (GNAT) family protein [Stella humosa]|uniref:Acetyltransferase (GNAT) family protein n=1 Tax=Stella humosa TaxID=94 RepID=A0A3N1LKS8_9PROT|nr:GNAT family N-acetyltransferase [Stella humosa]ROP91026.1 acetyltransferase (GNAT) family protein [Stella humosa]BBK34624.1 N-acetyltransferase [Stella humosa]
MTSPLVVRPVAPGDHARWLPLWEGYNTFYERVAAPEVTAMTWARFFDSYEPVHALVAEQDGAILGIVHYLFHRNTSMIGPTCYLQDLFTSQAARGKGVGRALIEAVYDRARQAGAGRVYWMTHETNRTAMRLYDQVAERSGFVQYRKNL